MSMNQTSDSLLDSRWERARNMIRQWRRDTIERVFKQFDEDSDGKLSVVDLIRCLSSCYGINVDDADIKKLLHVKEDGKIEISEILQAYDGDHEDNFFGSLRNMDSLFLCVPLQGLILKNMQAKAFNEVKPEEEDHVAIDISHLNVSLASIFYEYSNISKLRDIFLALTGQAAVSFFAFAPTRSLRVLAAVNALAFLLLLISFWLRAKKLVAAERATAAIGICSAVLVFFLMMGMIDTPAKLM